VIVLSIYNFKIRSVLEMSHEEAVQEYQRVTNKLVEYESVGMGFDKLAFEYSKLLNQIDEKKWALSQLQRDALSNTNSCFYT